MFPIPRKWRKTGMVYDSIYLDLNDKEVLERDTIVETLQLSKRPLSIKEIRSSVNSINQRKKTEYHITRLLRKLSNGKYSGAL